ncbi:Ig-like domain-containing protein [Tumebacillus sp. BK434]|uniref:OmpL47-type beta-barrel domain-containing protein n=1 Tax=Tumebacillus sp. BK434 TaxID=2512169 RepID=UPI001FB485EF|nr:Ig-like domain-containing protein [Tumebacillus sp. BK434]
MTLAFPLPAAATLTYGNVAQAEGPTDPAPVIPAKVVNENAGKKVLFDNTHGQTAGAADWVIDGGFSDFGNALAENGYYVKELRKTSPITLSDLQDYDVFIIGEANNPYKKSEQDAMLQFVQNGGSIFFIGDHYNADRNKNRWDANEVFNGYRRGAWENPAKGMSAQEAASAQMQGVQSSDWLGQNFGIRFRFNALADITATNVAAPADTFGITQGVKTVAMHAGATLAILDPNKAKGLVYMPKTNERWANAVDQGVYNGGGIEEGPYAAIAKVGGGKAAFIGDSSPVEDATPKYLREDTGKKKTTYDGFKEQDDATLLVNMVNWLAKKENYTSFANKGIALDPVTPLLAFETPQNTTEPQPEPWAAPDPGYLWYDSSTFKPGSYGSVQAAPVPPVYSTVHQAQLPANEVFQIRMVGDNFLPNSTVSGFNLGIYLAGGTQVAQVQNPDGTWPTSYGYSAQFSMTADAFGHATKTVNVRLKPGTALGDASLRIRQASTALATKTVTIANVPAEQLPEDKPPVPTTITIGEARDKAVGQLVTVQGVITTQPGAFGGQGFYLQDETGGVYVFQSQAGFNVGDRVEITAATEVYNTEFELTEVMAIKKIGTAELPAAKVVNAVDATNQGQRVTLENVKISNLHGVTPAGSFEFNATNDNGTTVIRVDGRTGLTLDKFSYKDGQTVTVSGVSSIFKGTFQLKPTALSDFAADTQAPVTTAAVSGQANANGWYNQDVTVTLTATDDKSGVARIEYQIGNGDWNAYTAPFAINTDGDHNVAYRAVDVNGNVEAEKSLTVKLDKTMPTVDVIQSGGDLRNVNFDETVSFSVQATDAASGVAAVELYLDDHLINQNAELSAKSLGLGAHTLRVRVRDNADNLYEGNFLFLVETNFASIDKLVNQLAENGEVKNSGIKQSLLAKLDTAERAAKAGNSDQAIKHLQQLQQTLNTYVKAGNISASGAETLNSNIEYLLSHDLK